MRKGFRFLREGAAVEVLPTSGCLRHGVIVGADTIGLGLALVQVHTCMGWRIEPEPKPEFIPWSAISRVEPIAAADLTDDLLPFLKAAGFEETADERP